jgi:hypothetical protein
MKYTITIKSPIPNDVELWNHYCETAAQAKEWGQNFAMEMTKTIRSGAFEFISVSPLEDSPQVTPRQVFALPGKLIEWPDSVIDKAIKFINELNMGITLNEYDYNAEQMSADGRLKVETKVDIYHDGERSTSLYVITFDDVNVGWYIGSGRGERDHTDAVLTDKTKAIDLSNYLLSLYTNPHQQPEPQVTGLDDAIPGLYDWLAGNGIDL